MRYIKYFWERSYPYIGAAIGFIVSYLFCMSDSSITHDFSMATKFVVFYLAVYALLLAFFAYDSKKLSKRKAVENKDKKMIRYARENIFAGLTMVLLSVVICFGTEEMMYCVHVSVAVLYFLTACRYFIIRSEITNLRLTEMRAKLYERTEMEEKEIEQIQNEFSDRTE